MTETLFNSTKTFNVNNYVMHTVGAKRYFCTALVSSEAHSESQTLSTTNTGTYHTTEKYLQMEYGLSCDETAPLPIICPR